RWLMKRCSSARRNRRERASASAPAVERAGSVRAPLSRPRALLARRAINQDGYFAADENLLRHAAEQHPLETGASVGSHVDQVATQALGGVHNPLGRRIRAIDCRTHLHARLLGEALGFCRELLAGLHLLRL